MMTQPNFEPLGAIVSRVFRYTTGSVYFKNPPPWSVDSPVALLESLPINPATYDEELDRPSFAIAHHLYISLLVSDIQQVIKNAYAQKEIVTLGELCEGISFYYKNDAFIEFPEVAAWLVSPSGLQKQREALMLHPNFESLGALVDRIFTCPSECVYFKHPPPWPPATTPVALLEALPINPATYDKELDRPSFAIKHHLYITLLVSEMRQVIENAYAQKATATLDELCEGIAFYYENDAFMTFSDEGGM